MLPGKVKRDVSCSHRLQRSKSFLKTTRSSEGGTEAIIHGHQHSPARKGQALVYAVSTRRASWTGMRTVCYSRGFEPQECTIFSGLAAVVFTPEECWETRNPRQCWLRFLANSSNRSSGGNLTIWEFIESCRSRSRGFLSPSIRLEEKGRRLKSWPNTTEINGFISIIQLITSVFNATRRVRSEIKVQKRCSLICLHSDFWSVTATIVSCHLQKLGMKIASYLIGVLGPVNH